MFKLIVEQVQMRSEARTGDKPGLDGRLAEAIRALRPDSLILDGEVAGYGLVPGARRPTPHVPHSPAGRVDEATKSDYQMT